MLAIKTNKMGKEILRLKWADPFRPFVIKTDDGKRRRVTYTMQVTVTPLGKEVAMFTHEDDQLIHFPVSTVVAVEPEKRRPRPPRKPRK